MGIQITGVESYNNQLKIREASIDNLVRADAGEKSYRSHDNRGNLETAE